MRGEICAPPLTEPSSAAMHFSASSWDGTVTKPKPRLRPVFMSETTVMSLAWKSPKTSSRVTSSTPS